MNQAEKFTDLDIYHHPYLEQIARDYALAYVGGFDFMRNARAMAESVGELTRGVARGVLNCMRLDPLVAGSLPEPWKVAPVVQTRPPLRAVPSPPRPPPRPRFIKLTSSLHWPWIYSVHPHAHRAHIATPATSVLKWDTFQEIMVWNITLWCGAHIKYENGRAAPTLPAHLEPCSTCLYRQDDYIEGEGDDRRHQDRA